MMRLNPDEWRRVRDCFEDALTVPVEQRERFVRDSCGDPALAAHVLSLLSASSQADSFLERSVASEFERTAATEDLSGSELGPYRIVERIGAGGMGDVYRARDSRLDRFVAIKVLPAHATYDDASRRRFEREARAVAALNHPHICTLHDIGVTPGREGGIRYLVMELLDGETLADVLTRGALPAATALEYAIQIASALRAAHRAGIIHRDLKPGNIMITTSGAKLLDFGLAMADTPSSAIAPASMLALSGMPAATTTLLGTIGYMAPEQLRGEPADARSDMFAFGCVLYEMVTGIKAFDHQPSSTVDGLRIDSRPAHVLEERIVARSGVRDIINTCLQPNRDDRWQTADDLLRALHSAVDANARRQRMTWLGAAVAAALLVAIGTWVFVPRRPPPAAIVASTPLAVLPLQPVGDISGDEHLGVAVADAIITRLATVPGVRLRPTTAVLNYRNASTDPADAATALHVDYVLTGTLQRGSSAYHMTFQLTNGPQNAVTWGRTYDVVRDGLRDLPATIAEQVAGALRLQFSSEARDGVRARYAGNPAAYDEYLQGRAALLNYTEAGMKDAIAAFERALAIDTDYAVARAGLALASAWWSIRYAYENEALQWGARAEKEARAALASDPSLAEARLAMAGAAGTLYGGFKWPAVIDDARRALALDPTLELAHVVLMRAYFHLGLFDQMRAEAEIARQLNPLGNVEVARLEVAASLFTGAHARARDQAAALLARSEAPTIRTYLGLAQFYTGDVDAARRTLAQGKPGTVAFVRSQAALASVEAAAGDREAARTRALAIEHGPYMDHHVAYSLGSVWAQLGDVAEAVRWLQQAAATGFPCYPSLQRDPLLDGIRQHPRFRAFLATLGQRFERDAAQYGVGQ